MKLLLDTHVFLWMHGDPDRLSARARELLIDADAEDRRPVDRAL
jgi:PIN domain nuclease of toxin-antitoxin system